MSAPFDLSDALKKPATPLPPPGSKKPKRRPPANVIIDDIARRTLWCALAVALASLAYLGLGLYSGTWTDPAWMHQTHEFRSQQLANITTVVGLLRLTVVVLMIAMMVVFLYDEGAGIALLIGAALLYYGVPLLTNLVFAGMSLKTTQATELVLAGLQTTGLIMGVPGLIWSCVDIGRRFKAAAASSAIRQANQKHAARDLGVRAPGKQRMTAFQRQLRRYQLICLAVIVLEPLLVILNLGTVENWMQGLLAVLNHLSFSSSPEGIAELHGADGQTVLVIFLVAINLVIIAQLLRVVEHFFYKDVA